jgi:MGT family glycosyltransferase
MARFLFTAWPFPGCVNPGVAVARVLASRGHEVAFYTGTRGRAPVDAHGWPCFVFTHLDERQVDALVYSSDSLGANWRRPHRLRPRLRALFADTVPGQFADLEAIIDRWHPDAVVSDPAMWAPFLLLFDLYRLPVAILSYAGGCMLPGPGAPPIGPGLPRPRGPVGRWRNRAVGAVVDAVLADTRRSAAALRRGFGLPVVSGPVIALAARLPLYLVPSCREFDYDRADLPPCVHYVGPLQWYPETPAPAWIEERDPRRPLVHATEGTLHVQDPFVLRATAEALAGLPLDVVITTGGRSVARLDLGRSAANVRLEEWVNHDRLLARTDVMVTTAGGGTVMAGLAAGVPMVLVPTEWDKAENAQRVVEAGAGIRLSPARCGPRAVRRAVERILGDPRYRRNARRLAAILSRQGGPGRAATLLEHMVGACGTSIPEAVARVG